MDRTTLWAVAISTIIAAAVLLAPHLLGLAFVISDASSVNLAHHCALRQQLEHDLGLSVYAHIGLGAPVLAHVSSQLLYPLRWVSLALPVGVAPSWESALHLALAAGATTWLCRTFRVTAFAAVSVGVAFAFTGPILDLLEKSSTYVVGALWLPVGWAGARTVLGSGAGVGGLALFAASALLLLGGDPQAFGVLVILTLIETVRTFARRARGRAVACASTLALVVAGLGVGWLQWGPTLAHVGLGPRDEGLTSAHALHWSFDPGLWPGVLWPGATRVDLVDGPSLHEVLGGEMTFGVWNDRPYLGWAFVALALVGAGLAVRRRWRLRPGVAPATALAATALAALGSVTPAYPLALEIIPVLTRFRYPAKYLVPATLCAAVLVALALSPLARSAHLRKRVLGLWVAGGAIGLVAATLLVVAGDLVNARAAALVASGRPTPDLAAALLVPALQGALLPIVGAIVLALRGSAARFIGGVVVADLLLAAPALIEVGPPLDDLTSLPAALATHERAPVMCHHSTMQRLGSTSGRRGWEVAALQRLWAVPDLQACDGLVGAFTYTQPIRTRVQEALQERGVDRGVVAGARALGCDVIIAPAAPVSEATAAIDLVPDPGLRGQGEPRAFVVTDPVPPRFALTTPAIVSTEDELVARLLEATSAEATLALVDDPLGRLEGRSLPTALLAPSRLEVTEGRPDRFVLDVDANGPVLVGVRTAYAPGWEARQGEEALVVLRAGGVHTAVLIEHPGRGPVVLEYSPPGLGGALAAAAAGAVVAALALVLLRRQRRAPAVRASAGNGESASPSRPPPAPP